MITTNNFEGYLYYFSNCFAFNALINIHIYIIHMTSVVSYQVHIVQIRLLITQMVRVRVSECGLYV